MVSQTKKTVLVYTLMITTSIWSEAMAQAINRGAANYQPPVYQKTPYTGVPYPTAKGYYNAQSPGSIGFYQYNPVNAQYWTGHPMQYPYNYNPYYQHQQYQYQQQYNPYPQYSPYPLQYHPQPYGYVHHPVGYAQSYGHYPSFDARYWAGSNYYGQGYNYPYHGQQVYYPGQQVYYPGSPYAYPHGGYPYQPKPFGKGFLGQHGNGIIKGVLGAVLIGAIAGKVARGK